MNELDLFEPDTDTIYVYREHVFYSPDGVGKVFYDSITEAYNDTDIDRVVYLLSKELQWTPIN